MTRLHGPEHPPVTFHAPAFVGSISRPGWTEVRFGVSGALKGFVYTVRLEAMPHGGEGRHYHIGGLRSGCAPAVRDAMARVASRGAPDAYHNTHLPRRNSNHCVA